MSSRADAYAAFYRESRGRLLHQVYAYCGDGEVAQRALADAFVSAGHHWRKIADDPHKDAWVRERAFKATGRSLNRARKPWYVRALRTADEHRPILVGAAGAAADRPQAGHPRLHGGARPAARRPRGRRHR